jgi:DNA invertase Pin-like site-specific DNA recombinase
VSATGLLTRYRGRLVPPALFRPREWSAARRTLVAELSSPLLPGRSARSAGCQKIFSEQVTAVGKRPQLEAALDFIREGDTLLVTKLDRLARSTQHLLEVADRVKAKGADLCILNLGADTSTATGRLMFTVIGAVGCFERELMLERQREGVARAKAEGKYKGRKPTARARAAEIATLKADGVRPVEIARRLGIGRASVYRVLGAEARAGINLALG